MANAAADVGPRATSSRGRRGPTNATSPRTRAKFAESSGSLVLTGLFDDLYLQLCLFHLLLAMLQAAWRSAMQRLMALVLPA